MAFSLQKINNGENADVKKRAIHSCLQQSFPVDHKAHPNVYIVHDIPIIKNPIDDTIRGALFYVSDAHCQKI